MRYALLYFSILSTPKPNMSFAGHCCSPRASSSQETQAKGPRMHTSLAGVLKVQDGERITLVDSANHAWSSDSFILIYLIATIINTPCEWERQSGVALAFDTLFY